MRRKILVGASALVLAMPLVVSASTLGATGASASTTVSGDHFVLVNGDNADPFFYSIWAGALYEAKQLGVTLTEQAPTTFDYTQQAPLINDAIAQKANGIILSPDGYAGPFTSEYKAAKAAGIPVVDVNDTQGLEKNNPNILSFQGSSNLLLGQLGAKAMAQLVGSKGLVSVINSTAGNQADEDRGNGFIDTVKSNYKQMSIVPEQYSGDNQAVADAIATDEILANPTLKGIYAVDSFDGQAVGTAIKANHKVGKIKVVGVDAEPQEVALMKQGVIGALIAQQPYTMGVNAVKDIALALEGKTAQVKRSVILPPVMVTPKNMNTPYIKTIVYAANQP